MLNENIIILAQKAFKGTASEEEIQQLNQWYDQWDYDEEIVNTYPIEDSEESVRLRMLMQLLKKIKQQEVQPAKVVGLKHRWYRFAAAASIILLLSAGAYVFLNKDKKQNNITETGTHAHDVAAPATNKAMITLADGKRVSLDSIQSGSLTKQYNVNVVKTVDGQIVYSGSSEKMAYNTLENPRGSKVQPITLSDGTKVWLNSESSLRYPVYFNENDRKVVLTGEAYFEVTKNAAKPFKVNLAGKGEVKVLGTHFNINSYTDEQTINTTLLEGKVKLSEPSNRNSTILSPGEQARLYSNGQIAVNKDSDMDEIMAWKNGSFIFDNQDIENIMRQLSRWYDVDINYQGKISKETYSGIVSRQSNITQVLKIMEAGGVKFSIEGKKIIVIE